LRSCAFCRESSSWRLLQVVSIFCIFQLGAVQFRCCELLPSWQNEVSCSFIAGSICRGESILLQRLQADIKVGRLCNFSGNTYVAEFIRLIVGGVR
jgi:hypothetical protein